MVGEQVQDGDLVGFDDFYASRWFRAVATAHAIVGSKTVAEELAQEAFVRSYQQWDSLRTPDAFLRTALVNLCRSQLRRTRLEQAQAQRRIDPTLPEPELDETWVALSRLSFRQRAVLVLRYYDDLSEQDIARALGCRIGTVKSAHHRALARLREELA